MQEISAENLFARSWQLLNRNWSIVVPGLVVAILAGALSALFAPTDVYVNESSVTYVQRFGGFGSLLGAVIQVFAGIISISYTTGMAQAAWQRGTATFADGGAAYRREGRNVFTALLALFVVFFVAAVLAPFTLGLSLLACLFLTLYTMAAAVVGDRGGFAALEESYRIATRRVGTTSIVVLVIGVIFVAIGLISAGLRTLPVLGAFVAEILGQAFLAYFTLVVVGEYLSYRAASPTPGSPTTLM